MKYKNLCTFGGSTIDEIEYDFICGYVKEHKIKNVLEFGTGISTYCFLENDCEIVSFEYQSKYFNYYKNIFNKYGNVNMVMFDNTNPIIIKDFTFPFFDMAFIDSPKGGKRKRHDCARLNSCIFSSDKTNTIMIHDSKRRSEITSIEAMKEHGWHVDYALDSRRGITVIRKDD